MADQITTITDVDGFRDAFTKHFTSGDVFIKTSSGNVKIQFLGFNDGNVAVRIPMVKNIPERIIIFTHKEPNTIYAALKRYENHEDTFTTIPEKIQIIAASRKEDRKDFGSSESKQVLYVSNLISDFVIERFIEHSIKKVEQIVETAIFELEKRFEHVKIIFLNRKKLDARMKYLLDKPEAFIINNLNDSHDENLNDFVENYIETIYKKDVQISRQNKYVSEATAPLKFKNSIMYGYIQVNNSKGMSDGLLEVVKRIAILVDELCIKNNIFAPLQEKLLIGNISRGGLGIVFKDRKYIRIFKEGSRIHCDLMLPTQKKIFINAIVRNIDFLENQIIKVGCQFSDMDEHSQKNYDEYLNKIGL